MLLLGASQAETYTLSPAADTATDALYNSWGKSLHEVHLIQYWLLSRASENDSGS